MSRKVLFILIDGLGDITSPQVLTPLQVARVPTFDYLASKGLTGLLDPVEAGVACGSDTAHLSLLGYNPRTFYRGRGAFESLGTGLEMKTGDIAFKCVFSWYNPEANLVMCRRPDRDFAEEARMLTKALDGLKLDVGGHTYTAHCKYATEHRLGVVVRGPGLTDAITGTDPLKDGLPLGVSEPLKNTPEAIQTAKVVNAFSNAFCKILETHPINQIREMQHKPVGNCVLFRGPGALPSLPSFQDTHGMKPFMVAPTCLIAGIGLALGMTLVKVPGATGDHRSDFGAKFSKALELLQSGGFDFGFVHIKAVDEASHSGEPQEKIELLERISFTLAPHLDRIEKDRIIAVITGDHTTPSYFHHDHTNHPVPFLICSFDEKHKDRVRTFDEISVASGALGRFTGQSVMQLIKRLRS